jgi:hypothetical protein
MRTSLFPQREQVPASTPIPPEVGTIFRQTRRMHRLNERGGLIPWPDPRPRLLKAGKTYIFAGVTLAILSPKLIASGTS